MYLYCAVQKKRFKIGVTKNLKNRLMDLTLDWGAFDLNRSFYVVGPADVITRLEYILLKLNKKNNMNYKKNKPPGYSEFFKIKSLPNIKKAIRGLGLKTHTPKFKITKAQLQNWSRFKAKFFAGEKK